MGQLYIKTYPIDSNSRYRLFELAQLLREFNIKYNWERPVYMIHMKSRIFRLIHRIGSNKIPQPKLCIAMLEKKLISYL